MDAGTRHKNKSIMMLLFFVRKINRYFLAESKHSDIVGGLILNAPVTYDA